MRVLFWEADSMICFVQCIYIYMLTTTAKSSWHEMNSILGCKILKWSILPTILSGANCNLQDKQGHTALLLASMNSHVNIVEVLLRHHANPDLPSTKGTTPLLGMDSTNTTLLVVGHRAECGGSDPLCLYWAIQAGLLTPLTFARHRLSPLAAFSSGAYFLHNERRWQWICEFYTANFKGIFGGPES